MRRSSRRRRRSAAASRQRARRRQSCQSARQPQPSLLLRRRPLRSPGRLWRRLRARSPVGRCAALVLYLSFNVLKRSRPHERRAALHNLSHCLFAAKQCHGLYAEFVTLITMMKALEHPCHNQNQRSDSRLMYNAGTPPRPTEEGGCSGGVGSHGRRGDGVRARRPACAKACRRGAGTGTAEPTRPHRVRQGLRGSCCAGGGSCRRRRGSCRSGTDGRPTGRPSHRRHAHIFWQH